MLMKEVCERTGLSYETLKFYCNRGLIPDVARDSRNYRVFDERHLQWIHGLQCLKDCGMSIEEIEHYLTLDYECTAQMDEMMTLLDQKRNELEERIVNLQASIAYIDAKKQFYQDLQSGKVSLAPNSLRYEGA